MGHKILSPNGDLICDTPVTIFHYLRVGKGNGDFMKN